MHSQNLPKTQATNTIKVSGMKPDTTSDAIKYYFESKRGGFADVVGVELIEERSIYLVTFEDQKAVERILEKTHTLDCARLLVEKYIPPEKYPNKVLISGINASTSRDSLENFLEAKTKLEVETIEYGEVDSTKAVVTFSEPIDINLLRSACQNKPLDGSILSVDPVVVSNCIIVRCYSKHTSKDTLDNYFDNKRKSGVEGVIDVKMNEEELYSIIYFDDAKDAVLACKKIHTVENCKLQVQVFYDCLGNPAGPEGPCFKPPPPIRFDIDSRIRQYLLQNESIWKQLETQLQNVNAAIIVSRSTEVNYLEITCTLSKEVKDCWTLAKTWETQVMDFVTTFIDQFATETVSVQEEIWNQVNEKVRNINILHSSKVAITYENPPICEIYVCGGKTSVVEATALVKKLTSEVTDEFRKKKEQILEKIPMKKHELSILSSQKFPEKIKNTFDGVEVDINTTENFIVFKGLSGDIMSAKTIMNETAKQIVAVLLERRSPHYVNFVSIAEVKSFIENKLIERNLTGEWNIQHDRIVVYSLSDDDAFSVSEIFKECVIETKIETDNLSREILSSQSWIQLKQALEDECAGKPYIAQIVDDGPDHITLFCTSEEEAGHIREKILDFLFFEKEKMKVIHFPPDVLHHIQEHMKELINQELELQKKNIIVTLKTDGILLRGCSKKEVNSAEEAIISLLRRELPTNLQQLYNPDIDPNISKYGDKQMQAATVSYQDVPDKLSNTQFATGASNVGVTFTLLGNTHVIIVKDDIITLDVDVIVNASNKEMKHIGGLAKHLIENGGKDIQEECDVYVRQHGRLSEGEIFCSGPGTLRCKAIIHAVGPVWQDGKNREEERLYNCVKLALKETEKRKLISVALPALCAGKFGYPPAEATKVITEGIRDYFGRNRSSAIITVYLCDTVDATIDHFIEAGNVVFSQLECSKIQAKVQQELRVKRFEERPDNLEKSGTTRRHIMAENIKIQLSKEALWHVKVDAIVNITSKNLELNLGTVSSLLLAKAGPTLQQECLKKYPLGIKYGEVAVTSGGNLQCTIVCHGSLDKWQSGSLKVMEELIANCLSAADKKRCKSIAFPALGTGHLGYPRAEVAECMYRCVKQYSSDYPKSNINEVMFILYERDYQTVKAFEEEERRRQRSASARPRKTHTLFD